jgi:Txe/YoeB family toxin of Txe-Axe toxin-antitoxin module
MEIKSEIHFGNKNIKDAFLGLDSKKYQENQLKCWLERAFEDLEKNAFSGVQIPKKLIPKDYKKKFGDIDNLWKYNLPNAWRLLYTIKRDQVIVLSIILEWLMHKDYEKRFKY